MLVNILEMQMHIHTHIDVVSKFDLATQVAAKPWPKGPSDLHGLFQWPSYNSERMLTSHDDATKFRDTFGKLLHYDIDIHESYAGLGTAGIALHLQHKHMKRTVLRLKLFDIAFHHNV